ncbi:DUF1643 domain-containing protein [Plantibacter flavus]|uniref:DUF1643 domain-containing protein n=1 Tax=Plantibacter flavus TaxID=150123 RepID=UPI0023784BA5|nr:DUF1643 domain-containing protein [Plantibacter flavus]MDD9153578.1 DUF1643 domain-containing protein [Plantibacter flavus]
MANDATPDDRLSSFIGSRILIVMSNPPLGTSGDRTMKRVALMRELLRADSTLTANLFALPTYRTGDISQVGQQPSGWLDARSQILKGVSFADAVVLAYGAQEPRGAARAHFRSQVRWLHDALRMHDMPTWTVGGRPLHPSRWHRHTHRTHPSESFQRALLDSLEPVDPGQHNCARS